MKAAPLIDNGSEDATTTDNATTPTSEQSSNRTILRVGTLFSQADVEARRRLASTILFTTTSATAAPTNAMASQRMASVKRGALNSGFSS